MRRLFLANGRALLLLLNFFSIFPSFFPLFYLSSLPSFLPVMRTIFNVQAPQYYLATHSPWPPSSPLHQPGHCSTHPVHPCFCVSGLAFALFPLPVFFPLPSSPIYSPSPISSIKVPLCSFLKIIVIMKYFNCKYLLGNSSFLGNLLALYHLVLSVISRKLSQLPG